MNSPSLLDTDILSELFKGNERVRARAAEYLAEYKCLTISHIQRYEVLKGLKAKAALKQIVHFNRFCAANDMLPITDDAIEEASGIYASLKSTGKIISDADILVAGIAISNNLVLITNNTNHFSRIEGLKLENWKR